MKYFEACISRDYDNKVAFEAKMTRFSYIQEKSLSFNYSSMLQKKISPNQITDLDLTQVGL